MSAILVITGACTATDPPRPSIVIGVLAAPDADDATRGAQLAIDIVNDSHPSLNIPLAAGAGLPRLGGMRLSLVSADTKGQTDLATRQANEFVTVRKAAAVVLADSAEVAMSVAGEVQRLRAPLVDAGNTADFLTELGMDWYFRAPPSDRSIVDGAFGLLRRQRVTKIAVVSEPGGDSAAGLALVRTAADAAGVQILPADGGGTDAGTGSGGGGNGPEATVAWAHTAAGAAALRQGKTPIVGLGKGFRDWQPQGTGPTVLRAVLWSADLARRSPQAQSIAQFYEKRFTRPMSAAAATSFTTVIAVALAIDSGGGSDPAAIRAALRQTSLGPAEMIMPWDGVRFSTDGHNSLASSAVEAWEGNAFRVVYPAELAAQPWRWPGARP